MRLSPRTICLSLTALCHGALAQEALPQFEVASIRQNLNPLARPFNLPMPGGVINYTGDSLKDLIAGAWRIDPDKIDGGPAWADSIRYDIRAKAPDGATAGLSGEQTLQIISLMVRSLVMERFHVAVHIETRELPIYGLVLARKDGRLGPALKESDATNCDPLDLSAAPAAFAQGKLPPVSCGMGLFYFGGRVRGSRVDLGQLSKFLNRLTDRPVVDKTSVSRKFDIDMEWPASLGRLNSPQDPAEPSLLTVLEDQLGLQLKSQKGPVEILMIDHAEAPSRN